MNASDAMLFFCEDCGKKHSVTEGGDENGRLQFRCDGCGFLITVTSVPPAKRRASAPDPSLQLACYHDELDFGSVLRDDEPEKTIFLSAKDGRKIAVEAKVLPEVKGNITVTQLSANGFKVRVVASAKMGVDLRKGYNGPGLDFFDTISGALHTVPVVFSRLKPSFALKPALVDLGTIGADVLAVGSFIIENWTAAPLTVTLTPDPHCFSLTNLFTLISDSSLTLAGGEKREVTFSVRLSDDADSDEQFDQVLLVTAGDSDERPAQRVRIIATLQPSTTSSCTDWGAIV